MGFFHRSHTPKTSSHARRGADWLKEIDFRERLFDEFISSDGQSAPSEELTFDDIIPPQAREDASRLEGSTKSTMDKVHRSAPKTAHLVTKQTVEIVDPIVGGDGKFEIHQSGAKSLAVGEVGSPRSDSV